MPGGPLLVPRVTDGAASVPATGGVVEMGHFVTNPTGSDWLITDAGELTGQASVTVAEGRQAIKVDAIEARVGQGLRIRVAVQNGLGMVTGEIATFVVDVVVTEAGGFLAGYGARRRLIVAPQAWAETVTGFVLLVRGTWADLRSVANGGRVRSETGNDIRFTTTGGVKLPHDLATYDPVTGTLTAWVRLSSWTMNSRYALFVYYGNSSQAGVPEADAPACWVDYVGVWDCRTGIDRSGNGRDFSVTSIAGDVLVGDAGRFDGAVAAGTMPSCAWLEELGLTACTLQAWVTTDISAIGQNRGVFLAGPRQGRGAEQSLALYQRASNATGSVVENWLFNVSTGDGSGPEQQGYFVSSGRTQSPQPQLIHAVWASGSAPGLSFNGIGNVGSGGTPGIASGSILALPRERAGPCWIGWGPDTGPPVRPAFPAHGPWKGLIDELRLRGGVMTLAHRRVEYLNHQDPEGFLGVGPAEDALAPVDAIVGMPIRARVANDAAGGVLIDVLSRVHNPSGHLLSLVNLGRPEPAGSAAFEEGAVRYMPAPGQIGEARLTVDVRDTSIATQDSRIPLRISVTKGAGTTSSVIDDLPVAGRVIRIRSAAELKQYVTGDLPGAGTPQPGDHIELMPGSVYRLPDADRQQLNVAIAGEASDPCKPKAGRPIVIRGVSLDDPPLLDFGFRVSGHDLVFYGLKWEHYEARFGNQRLFRISGQRVRVARCWFLDYWHKHNLAFDGQHWLNKGAGVGCVAFVGGGSHGRVDHCELSPRSYDYANLDASENRELVGVRRGIGFEKFSATDLKGCVVDHNFFHDFPSKLQPDGERNITGVVWQGQEISLNCYDNRYPSCLVFGEDAGSADTELCATAYRNHYLRCNQSSDANVAETKSSNNLWYQEYFKDCDAFFATRQGWNNRMFGIRADGLRKFDVYGNLQDVRGLYLRNSLKGLQIMAGNTPGDRFVSNTQPACWNSRFTGCDVNKLRLGEAFSNHDEMAKNLKLARMRVGEGVEGVLWASKPTPPPGVSMLKLDSSSLQVSDAAELAIPELAPILVPGTHVGPTAPSVLPEDYWEPC